MKLRPGTTVAWNSTANGSTTGKEGVIVGFIPAKQVPVDVFPELKTIASSQDKLGYGKYGESTNNRYLVRVDRQDKRTGAMLMPHYYAPRASVIEKAMGVEG